MFEMQQLTFPFGIGFSLGFSLILAIGAQNAFVLRQGLMRRHVGALVLFCSLSDALLILVGVGGLSSFIAPWIGLMKSWLFGFAAIWLASYGLIRGYKAWYGQVILPSNTAKTNGLFSTLSIAMILTFGNPHVYLDTVILIGTVSLQFDSTDKVAFAIGAICASFVFFVGLGYGAVTLSGIMNNPRAWRLLDAVIALVMMLLAFGMAQAGNWL